MDWLAKFASLLPCAFGPDHPFGSDHPFGVRGMADLLVRYTIFKYSIVQSVVHDQDV